MADEDEKKVDEEWKRRAAQEAGSAPDAAEEPHTAAPRPLEASFSMLVTGLAGQALIYLGAVAHPASGKAERDLDQAKYTIDLLQVVKEKACGNLTGAEQALLDGVLYDLRMRYVESCR